MFRSSRKPEHPSVPGGTRQRRALEALLSWQAEGLRPPGWVGSVGMLQRHLCLATPPSTSASEGVFRLGRLLLHDFCTGGGRGRVIRPHLAVPYTSKSGQLSSCTFFFPFFLPCPSGRDIPSPCPHAASHHPSRCREQGAAFPAGDVDPAAESSSEAGAGFTGAQQAGEV